MKYYTEADLTEAFGVTPPQIANWRRLHGWPHLKIGRSVRFAEQDLAEIENLHRTREGPQRPDPSGLTKLSAARRRGQQSGPSCQ